MHSIVSPEHWIQFEGRKFGIKEFVQHFAHHKNDSIQSVVSFMSDWLSDTPYILQQTSGSTGKPKTIKILKQQMKASASATLDTLGIRKGDHALLSINPDYIGGKMMIARAIVGNLNLTIGPIAGHPLQDLDCDEAVDFFSFVPYQMSKILEESPKDISILDQSKAIILGGAAVSDLLASKIQSNFHKSKVYSTYGMTETVSHVALKLLNSASDEAFKALRNVYFSTDENNCLRIEAPQISGQEQLVTQDVVNLLSSTEFHWLGRHDFVINSAGIKIHPEVLEKEIAVLFNQKNISNRFFVHGFPDEKLGEALHLIVEGTIDSSAVMPTLKSQLQPYHTPKKILTTPHFVETGSGKVSRVKTIENMY